MKSAKNCFNREMLIGRWYRSDTDDNGNAFVEYAEMSIDGSYEFTFIEQNHHGDVIAQSIEIGDWGLVGDIHFTMTKSEFVDGEHYAADLSNAENYHAYQVLTLNSTVFEYQHILSNEVFILRRVIGNIAHC